MKNKTLVRAVAVSILVSMAPLPVRMATASPFESETVEIPLVAVVNVSNLPTLPTANVHPDSVPFVPEQMFFPSEVTSLVEQQSACPAVVDTSNPPLPHPAISTNHSAIIAGPVQPGLGFTDPNVQGILDVQLGVGPNHVMELVNSAGRIWTKNGPVLAAPLIDFDLPSFFSTPAGGGDPRLFFDSVSQRWFASEIAGLFPLCPNPVVDPGCLRVRVAVSATSDPTGTWYLYDFKYGANPAGRFNLPDQPIIGSSDDKLVISANVFGFCDGLCSFLGAQFYVADKLAMMAGSQTVSATFFSPSVPNINFAISIHPVRSLASTPILYMVSVNGGSGPFNLYSVSGSGATATVSVQTFCNLALTPQPATQKGGSPIGIPDSRVLDAAWYMDMLWVSANNRCIPTGDTGARSCIRLFQLDTPTSSPSGLPASIAQNFDYGIPGFSLFYSALSMDQDGNLLVVFSYSSPNDFPSIAVTGQKATDPPNTVMQPLIIKAGSGFDACCRWGDYLGAAVDPSYPSYVWVAGEDQASSIGQGTESQIVSVHIVP